MTAILPIVAASALVTAAIVFILRTARRGTVNFGGVGIWHQCGTCEGRNFDRLPPSGLCRTCGVSGGHYTS